jgi:hypothetical protein
VQGKPRLGTCLSAMVRLECRTRVQANGAVQWDMLTGGILTGGVRGKRAIVRGMSGMCAGSCGCVRGGWLGDVDSGAQRSPARFRRGTTTCRSRACPSCPPRRCYLLFDVHSQKSGFSSPIFSDLHVMSSTLTAVHS